MTEYYPLAVAMWPCYFSSDGPLCCRPLRWHHMCSRCCMGQRCNFMIDQLLYEKDCVRSKCSNRAKRPVVKVRDRRGPRVHMQFVKQEMRIGTSKSLACWTCFDVRQSCEMSVWVMATVGVYLSLAFMERE